MLEILWTYVRPLQILPVKYCPFYQLRIEADAIILNLLDL
jgi:hypothetical protein